jgi:hypothetical protein
MKKILGIFVVFLILATTASAGTTYKLKTIGYDTKTIEVDGKQLDSHVSLNIEARERCTNCKFNRFSVKTSSRIRYYGKDNGLNYAFEVKNINPDYIEITEEGFTIKGTATIVEFNEPYDRNIGEREVLISYHKLNKQLSIITLDKTIKMEV